MTPIAAFLLPRRHVASCCEDVVRNVSNETLVTFPGLRGKGSNGRGIPEYSRR